VSYFERGTQFSFQNRPLKADHLINGGIVAVGCPVWFFYFVLLYRCAAIVSVLTGIGRSTSRMRHFALS
jgi:hypothetical protein